MGRAKKKRKMKLRRKRHLKKKQGKRVPFTLSNYPNKLKGIAFRYEYKINVHHCVFTGATFNHVRYRSGHITNSSFRNAKLNNIDFICVNLKNNRFRQTSFNNCVFFGCNMEKVDFRNATFKNTYFINCKLNNLQNFALSDEIHIITKYPELDISTQLEDTLHKMSLNTKLEKFRILTINTKKNNNWMLMLLLSKYSDKELVNFFEKLLITNKSQFYSIHDYEIALQKYYRK
ncbi:pentapeptide repeat-containing protein [Listeria monocytogenes]|nr:pentapeptide repeat-containing protein [Listeria monocytogenes]EGF3724532.1 pentapeptide repeat-containing protein [Listeria monocytogenes]EJQ3479582.1 pentapeptide repeat-containing protein [Listeria monocytogenes]EJQ3479830.1 pentapeptide repeat-containing protein [Listeria monocytogenes]